MSGQLVALAFAASFAAYIALALRIRRAAVSGGRRSVGRGHRLSQALPYFVWVPYVIVALRPGPELPLSDPVRWFGLGLVLGGVAIAMWAALTLGRHFDHEVEVHEGHEVVRRGPYAIVRHPVYSGLALHNFGAFLATGNLLFLAGTLAVSLPAFYIRAKEEERLLRAKLGASYDDYAREVPMLIPGPR
ncbi:MAG: isoprenylcysteine carboxylmethyltransferase family protein [Candidatus Limnocylindria bacterium]